MREYYAVVRSGSLSHHGIKGQKWGVRRFQNEDGTLTAEGKQRYLTSVVRFSDKRVARAEAKYNAARDAYDADRSSRRAMKRYFRSGKRLLNANDQLMSEHIIEKQNAEKRQSKAQGQGDTYKAEQSAAVADSSKRQILKSANLGAKVSVELMSRGANITVKDTTRTAQTGRTIAASIGMTIALNTLTPLKGSVITREGVVGSKFKVKQGEGKIETKPSRFRYKDAKKGERRNQLRVNAIIPYTRTNYYYH